MGEPDVPGAEAPRSTRVARSAGLIAKVKRVGATLRDEFEAGKRGDPGEPERLWPSAKEQLAAMMALLTATRHVGPPTPSSAAAEQAAEAEAADPEVADTEAAEVAEALGGIDWAGVRAATAERTGDAAKAMRTMAGQVDWAKVQPVAAQLSSALIAAVASGQLGIGGRLGPIVARAIVDQAGLGQRVANQIGEQRALMPPDFRSVIDATAREV